MSDPSPHRFVADGRAAGVHESVLSSGSAHIARVQTNGARPIFSLGHLAHLTGAPYLYLRTIIQRVRDPYSDVALRKGSGGIRAISVPEPSLMDVQRVILERALRTVPLHTSSFAYREGRSIVDCAREHVGARWLIKVDLHDFFGQVQEKQAFEVFVAQGYSPLVALELARLCTRTSGMRGAVSGRRYTVIPSYDAGILGTLPQGAPTSGAIANAVATPLDHALHALAIDRGFAYTRYSDDMVFSTPNAFVRMKARDAIREIAQIVEQHGFQLHRRKTRVVPPGARHIVLGLVLHDDGVRLSPEFRRRVEVHIRGVRTFGLVSHSDHRGFRSVLSFVNHLDGCLAFASSVEPTWTAKVRDEWDHALRHNEFPAT